GPHPPNRWRPSCRPAGLAAGAAAGLVDRSRGVLEYDLGEDRGVGLVRQVGAEPDADVEGPVNLQADAGAGPAQLIAILSDVDREGVPALLDADARGRRAGGMAAALDAEVLLDVRALRGALRQVDQAGAVQGDHDLLRIVI